MDRTCCRCPFKNDCHYECSELSSFCDSNVDIPDDISVASADDYYDPIL